MKVARKQLGQAKVPDIEYRGAAAVAPLRSVQYIPVVGREDFGRLEVPVDDAAGVDVGRPHGDLNGSIGLVTGETPREEDYGRRRRVGGVLPPDPVFQR